MIKNTLILLLTISILVFVGIAVYQKKMTKECKIKWKNKGTMSEEGNRSKLADKICFNSYSAVDSYSSNKADSINNIRNAQ